MDQHMVRLSAAAESIQAVSERILARRRGSYASAVLNPRIIDLVRDADVAELGLFQLAAPDNAAVSSATGPGTGTTSALGAPSEVPSNANVARTEFHGATPLLKTRVNVIERETDPETFAKAALRFLGRYQDLKPMPRARQQIDEIITRIDEVRARIKALPDHVIEEAHPTRISSFANEEHRITEIERKMAMLRKRKEALLASGQVPASKTPEDSSLNLYAENASTPDSSETRFWTDGSPALSKLDSLGTSGKFLMDESLGDNSFELPDDPLASPLLPTKLKSLTTPKPVEASVLEGHDPQLVNAATRVQEYNQPHVSSDRVQSTALVPSTELGFDQDQGDETLPEDEADVTVVLQKPPDPRPSPTPTTPRSMKPGRVKVTSEVERVSTKIWASVGELISPGHKWDVSSGATSMKPPRAKETISLLRDLSYQEPSSPSAQSSTLSTLNAPSSAPTIHVTLTAIILLSLLQRPTLSMPLVALKKIYTEQETVLGGIAATAITAGSGNKAFYGCVAKRLLKVDRGGGEQIVRFDI